MFCVKGSIDLQPDSCHILWLFCLLQKYLLAFSVFYKKYFVAFLTFIKKVNHLTTPSSYFIIGLPPPAVLEFLDDDLNDDLGDEDGDHDADLSDEDGDHENESGDEDGGRVRHCHLSEEYCSLNNPKLGIMDFKNRRCFSATISRFVFGTTHHLISLNGI